MFAVNNEPEAGAHVTVGAVGKRSEALTVNAGVTLFE
jgi:hypothetical protein